jgi:DNA-binding NarL/FixJ family response regulator
VVEESRRAVSSSAPELADALLGGGVHRIHITRDVPALATGLGELLAGHGIEVTYEYRGQPLGPHCGILVTHRLEEPPRRLPSAWGSPRRVLAAQMAPDLEFHLKAIRSGYDAVVDGQSVVVDLVNCVRAVLSGFAVVPPEVIERLPRDRDGDPASALDPLERRWLMLLAEGKSVVELAHQEGYSQRAVYRRLSLIYRKLGVTSRAAAIAVVSRAGEAGPVSGRFPARGTAGSRPGWR